MSRAVLKVWPASAVDEMAAFDALPVEIRARLRDLPVSVAAVPLLRAVRAGDPERLRRACAQLDRAFPRQEGA